jgi:hypothetical protein
MGYRIINETEFFCCFCPLVNSQFFQPVAPLFHTFAGFCGDEKDFCFFIQFGNIGFYFLDIEVGCVEDVDFVDEHSSGPGENHRVFGGFVVAFGDGEDGDFVGFAEVEGRGADEVADVFDEEQIEAVDWELVKGVANLGSGQMAGAVGIYLMSGCAGFSYSLCVDIGLDVAFDDADA